MKNSYFFLQTIILFLFFEKVFCQINPLQIPAYNLKGTFKEKEIFVHILDNQGLEQNNYYFFKDAPHQKISLFQEPVPQNLKTEVFDVWREEKDEVVRGHFLITTPPSELNIQGIWVDIEDKEIQYPFQLKHSLNLKGTMNNKSILMRLDFQGVNPEGKALYEGIYWFKNESKVYFIQGTLDYTKGFEILTEEDEEGNFIAFFEFQYPSKKIIWHSADGKKNYEVILYY